MHRFKGFLAASLALSMLALAACSSPPNSPPLTVIQQSQQAAEKALIAARASETTLCAGVISLHAEGVLVGANFN